MQQSGERGTWWLHVSLMSDNECVPSCLQVTLDIPPGSLPNTPLPSPTLSPTDPVPRGLLTLCPLWPVVSTRPLGDGRPLGDRRVISMGPAITHLYGTCDHPGAAS